MKKLMCFIMIIAFTLSTYIPSFAAFAPPANSMELNAFYPSNLTFSDKIKKYIDKIDTVSFAWARIYAKQPDKIITVKGEEGNEQNDNTLFYFPDDYQSAVKYSKQAGKSINLSIFSDRPNIEALLPNQKSRAASIKAITDLLSQDLGNGIYFDGVVIDFEGLTDKDLLGKQLLISGKPMSYWLNQFLKELKVELAKINKRLTVAVNPLLNYSGYDYGYITDIADRMIVMAHDYEPITSLTKEQILQYTGYNSLDPIDGLAPIKQIHTVMKDIKNKVKPTNINKVMLQISFDAAQWRYSLANADSGVYTSWNKLPKSEISMEERNTPTYDMIKMRLDNVDGKGKNITYSYNNELQTPVIEYENVADSTHNVILFENTKSMSAKINTAKEYGLGGISIWSLGNVPDYTDKAYSQYGLNVWNGILASVSSATPTSTTTSAAKTKITFEDKGVEASIRARIGKPTGTVYKSDIEKIYRLKVTRVDKTLNDLKKLPNLEYLDLSNTKVKYITPLSSLKNLRVLYLQRNNISTIAPLKALTKLEVLSLNGNQVSDISALSGLTQVRELYIRDNKVNNYTAISKLNKLDILYLKGNPATNYAMLSNIKKNLVEKDF